MRAVPSSRWFLTALVAALVCAGEASALDPRTFVSGLGSDANPCTRTAPCRTFGTAIAQTQAGGEVVALDSAGYGPVTITKAISLISPPGVYAGITTTTAGTDAITVTAGASDEVVLKGLSLSGLGLGRNGVLFTSGKALRVESLTSSGFTEIGVYFLPTATARLTVAASSIRDNGFAGVYALGQPGQLALVAIDGTTLTGTFQGVVAQSSSRVTVRDSVATDNASGGFMAVDANAVMNLVDCMATDNSRGIYSSGLVRAAGTTVSDNVTGLFSGVGGSILSRGNNTVEGNGTNGAFTTTFAAK